MTAPPRPLDDLTRDLRATQKRRWVATGVGTLESYPIGADPLALEAADEIDRLRIKVDGLSMEIADAKIDPLTREPKVFAYDVICSLAPFTIDHVTRYRRRIDLDGRKYSIILSENIPSKRDGKNSLYLAAHFLSYGYEWPESDTLANVVAHFAEVLWERTYRPAPKIEPPITTKASIIVEVDDAAISEITAKAIRSALVILRPILKAHRLSDVFRAPGGRECVCGKFVADVDGQVDHVLTLLAFGNEPGAGHEL